MKLNFPQKVCLTFLLLLIVFWFVIHLNHLTGGFYNYLYSFLFGLIPLVGGIVAIFRSHIWGGLRSAVGKAVFYIGLGILLWGCGEMIWSYYNFFLGVAAPYPSLADIGFAPSIFFYGLGSMYLSNATGAKFAWRNHYAKLFVTIALAIISFFSYYILVTVARNGIVIPPGETTLKAILDVAYPLGDFVALCLAVIISGLSFRYLGGKYKADINSILLGLGVMFVADSLFSYTTTVGTYYNADFGDLLLTVGVFLLTFGVLGFYSLKAASTPTNT